MPVNGLLTFLSIGAVLGLSAGISPGPLLALVISETLRHNKREGIKIALTPLITDVPIIIFSLIVLFMFAGSQVALSVISFLGGVFVVYLGVDCLNTRGLVADTQKSGIKSIGKGTIVNILNPHPYFFWITVGAPMVMKARQSSIWAVVAYFLAFYLFLVGSKIIVALLVDKSREFLKNSTYIWIMRGLGIILLVFAVLFFYDGIFRFRSFLS
jgi:threonine/homoserine/homoserine lactone efflux protein